LEGVREVVMYDKDEREQLEWTGTPDRHILLPHVKERFVNVTETAAFDPTEESE